MIEEPKRLGGGLPPKQTARYRPRFMFDRRGGLSPTDLLGESVDAFVADVNGTQAREHHQNFTLTLSAESYRRCVRPGRANA